MLVKVLFSLGAEYTNAQLDKAYDDGLVDGDWVTSGAGTYGRIVEFTREGISPEAVLKDAGDDLTKHGILFDRSYVMEIDGVWQNVNPKYS